MVTKYSIWACNAKQFLAGDKESPETMSLEKDHNTNTLAWLSKEAALSFLENFSDDIERLDNHWTTREWFDITKQKV